ncbi:MAG: porin [Rhodospirillaceae bacterium]
MKNYLLTGCAVVALAGISSNAIAQTAPGRFDIKLGGDAYFSVSLASQGGNPESTKMTDFTNRFRLQITPTAKADNGIEYGANLRVRAYLASGLIDSDQAYIFVGGNFGRIEAGMAQGPNTQYAVTAPNGFGSGGVEGDWSEGMGLINNQNTFLETSFGNGFTTITNTANATKLNYFTPRFMAQSADNTGLMGMLSYAPTGRSIGTDASRQRVNSLDTSAGTGLRYAGSNCPGNFAPTAAVGGTSPLLQACAYDNITEAGLRYDGTFQRISLSGSLGYVHGDAEGTRLAGDRDIVTYHNLEAFQVGAQLGYAGYLIGASYVDAGRSGYARPQTLNGAQIFLNDQTVWTAGISYETGPVVVGVNYAHGTDAGDIYVPGKRKADLISVGAIYTIAPGMTTTIEYTVSSTRNEVGYGMDTWGDTTVNSGNANLFMWKSAITF